MAPSPATGSKLSFSAFTALCVAALGVVYGDIGTSPLYALRECFVGSHGIPITPENVLGAVSLVFWFLVIIVAVKYAIIVLQADNKGEGGILALMALVHQQGPARLKNLAIVSLIGAVGAALLFGNSIITPAVSVLSAIEGLSVISPAFTPLVIPLSLIILVALFAVQSHGTARLGAWFGPVIILWFGVMAVLGFAAILKDPTVLKALNPKYAVSLMISGGYKSLWLLATAFLSVTGAEVMYADMGHFGKSPVRITWFFWVFPSLALNYLGQGAILLQAGVVPENLFFRLAPSWFLFPTIVIATLATIIASQAVITGMFSLAKQAVQLGFWPRIKVVHTSRANPGQVYLPLINVVLLSCTVILVLSFKKSGSLVSAYGIAVAATMLLTTCLLFLLPHTISRLPAAIMIPVFALFFAFDSVLFIANCAKLLSGGWVMVLLSVAIAILMTSWIQGRTLLRKKVEAESLPLDVFVTDVLAQKSARVKGTAVFLAGSNQTVPRALLHNFKHNQALHERVVVGNVISEEVPFTAPEERVSIIDIGSGFFRMSIRFGFMETPDVPAALKSITFPGDPVDPMRVSYFLGKETLVISNTIPMSNWRKALFLFLSRNSESASQFFKLPPNRVVEFGAQIEF
jgi:KUP system potassium uptake protein